MEKPTDSMRKVSFLPQDSAHPSFLPFSLIRRVKVYCIGAAQLTQILARRIWRILFLVRTSKVTYIFLFSKPTTSFSVVNRFLQLLVARFQYIRHTYIAF